MKTHTTVLLLAVSALICVGLVTLYSVTSVKPAGDPLGDQLFSRHLIHLALGLAGLVVAANVNYRVYRNKYLLAAIVLGTVGLLVYVWLFGQEVRGARRWIRLLGFQFQPSDLAKFTAILFLSVKLAENQPFIRTFSRGFAPAFAIAGCFAGLIVIEPDLGVPVVIMATAYAMMFVAGVRTRYLVVSLMPVVALVTVLIIIYPYRLLRFIAFLNPWKYRQTAGFHLVQSLAAFARGGLTGQGAGAGEQKLLYLPDAHTDFIFAVWGEEMGLMGTLPALLVFLLLLYVGIRIAMRAPDLYGSFLAAGIVSLISIQALVNVSVTTGLIPTKGLPLPFVSSGGTSTVLFLCLIGVLVNIGSQAEETELLPDGAYGATA